MEYGLFNWWTKSCRPDGMPDDEYDQDIHPEDLNLANEIDPFQKVFIKSGEDNEYIKIEYGKYHLRVKPARWASVVGDGFQVGDQVQIKSNNTKNTPTIGEIISMYWHFKNRCVVYKISEHGKVLKKQYFKSDLELYQSN